MTASPTDVSRGERRPDLPVLTTLRFFAALYVFLYHGAEGYVGHPLAKSFIGTGYISVDFFFVLSGFVLAYRYSERDGRISVSRRSFWKARFARIYPIYITSIVIGAPLYVDALQAGGHAVLAKAVISFVACVFLLQSWFYRLASSWNGPSWTLSVEAFLYFAMPFATPRVINAVRAWGARVTIGALWICALALPTAFLLVHRDQSINAHSDGALLNTLRYTPIVHLPSFLIGVVAGWSFLHEPRALPRFAGIGLTILLLGALAAGAWLPYPMLHSGLLSPLFVAVIYCAATATGPISRLLGSRAFVLLGDASYALYLFHYPLLVYATEWAGGSLSLTQFIVLCVVVQLISIAAFKLIETPCRRWLRRVL